jgi:hypothetical protein
MIYQFFWLFAFLVPAMPCSILHYPNFFSHLALGLQVLDKHLSILAKQHVETRFIKVHAEKAPFLTEKLRIVVLPTVAIVKNGKVEDYVVSEHYC